MVTLVIALSGLSGLALFLLLVVAFFFVARVLARRSSDFDSTAHEGKAQTHNCKFDRDEVRRTESQPRPREILPHSAAPDPRVAALLGNVQAAEVLEMLRALTGEKPVTAGGKTGTIASRNTYSKDIDFAMTYLEEHYRALGLNPVRDPYKVRGKTYYNLVVEIPGTVNPEKVLIVGSHLDSTAGDTWRAEAVAPGADDDGSGTAALAELARKIAGLSLGCTVRLVHFTGEEQGLWGSYAYADKVYKANTNVIAMIQLDMVGYCAKPGNRLDIHDEANRNGSHALYVRFAGNVSRYGLNLNPFDTHNKAVKDRSDHAGFLDRGYRCLCISEEFTDSGFNPNYHSTGDRVATLNLPFLVEVIRLLIATVADLAEIQP
jgi:Zn-dependent M28 family amino/carboxypeptidase